MGKRACGEGDEGRRRRRVGREGERRRGKRGEAEGRTPRRRSWGGSCGGGRSGAWAAAPTTFTRETGNLRARGAPLPARPPSYIRETCPGHHLPCACAAGSGRGAMAGGGGRDATATAGTALGTAGLVGGGTCRRRRRQCGRRRPLRWGGALSCRPRRCPGEAGDPEPSPQAGQPRCPAPRPETRGNLSTCCCSLNQV